MASIIANLSDEKCAVMKLFRKWVENEAEFYGRTDDNFLLIFLRFCAFDVDGAKRAMTLYYENRAKYPMWWADRDLKSPHMRPLLQSNFATLIKCKNPDLPCISIARFAKVRTDSSRMDDWIKLVSVMMDVRMRRADSQLNGEIVILDLNQAPLWMMWSAIWPGFSADILNSFLFNMPLHLKAFIILNCPYICLPVIKSILVFVSQSWKQKLHCFGSDWSKLGELVPLEALPEEYGGSAGPIAEHEEAFLNELALHNDYLIEDNKYGFQSKVKPLNNPHHQD